MALIIYFAIAIVSVAFLFLFVWGHMLYGYWKRKGVKSPEAVYLLGNVSLTKIAPGELYNDLYEKYKGEKYLGIYEFVNPRLLVIDPTVIQSVLIKDFSHFTDRASTITAVSQSKKNDGGIFAMTGHKWKAVRNKLSPTFTSGKLKTMIDMMNDSSHRMDDYIKNKGGNVEARDFMFSYTIDTIGSCAFGLDINRDKETAENFRRVGLKALAMDLPKLLLIQFLTNFPFLLKIFKAPFMNVETRNYFGKVLSDALKFRRETGYRRNDFLQLLIQLKDKGSVEHHAIEPEDEYLNIQKTPANETFEFTENMVMAQAFTFITAGMEPSGNTLTLVISELAWRQDIQNKVREEVHRVFENHDNHCTYNALKDMEYLENCILETLRLYPVAKQLRRICTKQYRLEDTITLDVGTNVIVPVKAIHMDPKYFPNPYDFNPDRFKTPSHPPCTFFPFGEGPRICIGMRFAMIEMKVALARLVRNYKLFPGRNFKYPIPLNKWSFFSLPNQPVNIRLELIN